MTILSAMIYNAIHRDSILTKLSMTSMFSNLLVFNLLYCCIRNILITFYYSCNFFAVSSSLTRLSRFDSKTIRIMDWIPVKMKCSGFGRYVKTIFFNSSTSRKDQIRVFPNANSIFVRVRTQFLCHSFVSILFRASVSCFRWQFFPF